MNMKKLPIVLMILIFLINIVTITYADGVCDMIVSSYPGQVNDEISLLPYDTDTDTPYYVMNLSDSYTVNGGLIFGPTSESADICRDQNVTVIIRGNLDVRKQNNHFTPRDLYPLNHPSNILYNKNFIPYYKSLIVGNWVPQNSYVQGTDYNLENNTYVDVLEFDNQGLDQTIEFTLDSTDDVYNNYSKIFFNAPIVKITGAGTTTINITQTERPYSRNSAENSTPYYMNLFLEKLEVDVNSNLELNLLPIEPDYYSSCQNSEELKGVIGGNAKLYVDDLLVNKNANLDLNIIGSSGTVGNCGTNHDGKRGGQGGRGGFASIDINDFYNEGTVNLDLNSGNGGKGGRGSNEGGSLRCKNSPKRGGQGGQAGHVIYHIANIYNLDENSILNINLNSGNGGSGGDAGSNHCRSDNARGGDASHGGNIVFGSNVNDIYNKGLFSMIVTAGNGGYGGDDTKSSSDGDGGSGGNIWDLKINKIINFSTDFNISMLAGEKGIGNDHEGGAVDGNIGYIKDIDINYLDNRAEGISITKQLNGNEDDFVESFKCCELMENIISPGSINIKYITSGSYLPNELNIINNNPINSSEIVLNGCYLKSSGVGDITYNANLVSITATNINQVINDFNKDEISTLIVNQVDCPYCDYYELNSAAKVNEIYTLYSIDEGIIETGDLNIYYARNDDATQIFTYPYDTTKEFLVYTNINEIEGIKANTEDEFYKFEINPSNLFYTKDEVKLFAEDKLYCPGQQYILKFRIKQGDEYIEDQFPFTPLYKLNIDN